MSVSLCKASVNDARELYDLQITCFKELLDKYQDFDSSPGAENFELTEKRFKDSLVDFYFILLNGRHIGGVRVYRFGKLCVLNQIFILPKFQGNGYAKKAISIVEDLYPEAERWELDTIKQEEKLCGLYEKMGYKKTGKEESIKSGLDLVFYAKSV